MQTSQNITWSSVCQGKLSAELSCALSSSPCPTTATLPSGGDRLGTDEETFKYHLTHENFAQLALIFSQYERLAGEPLSEALEDEFSRTTEDAMLAIGEGEHGGHTEDAVLAIGEGEHGGGAH